MILTGNTFTGNAATDGGGGGVEVEVEFASATISGSIYLSGIGFILEMADDPAGPWLAANAIPATNGTYKVVVLEPLALKKFYRLRKP
jgi:hypothetical protein